MTLKVYTIPTLKTHYILEVGKVFAKYGEAFLRQE